MTLKEIEHIDIKKTTKKYKNRAPILFRYPNNLLHKGSKGGRKVGVKNF